MSWIYIKKSFVFRLYLESFGRAKTSFGFKKLVKFLSLTQKQVKASIFVSKLEFSDLLKNVTNPGLVLIR